MNMLGLKVMNDKMVVVAAGVPFVVTTNSSKPNEVQCVMANGEFSEKIEFGHVDTIQKLIEDLSQSSENSNGYSNGDNKLSIQVRLYVVFHFDWIEVVWKSTWQIPSIEGQHI